jgi:hypothetical protein
MNEATIIAAVFGLSGIALGAWLNAHLTTRRERWNLKRGLYGRLLKNLGEAKHALSISYDNETIGPPLGDNDEALKAWEDRRDRLFKMEADAVKEIRISSSVAIIILNDEALKVIRELQDGWEKANQADTMEENIDSRLAVTIKAYDLLARAAKADLNI